MATTSIEWTEVVWNPTTGCDRVSAGCDHCYALTLAKRLKAMGAAKYQTDGDPRTSGPGFGLAVHEDTLSIPLGWRTPRKVFVNSMSDLFHDSVPDEFIADVFAVIARTPQHTYQILTKRHARMRSLLGGDLYDLMAQRLSTVDDLGEVHDPRGVRWPLPNVWLGVSVETQQWADIRIPALLDTPAAVRWLSCEPLLGPVNAQPYLWSGDDTGPLPGIDWLIAGGESGTGARPMHPDWARSLRDQCQAARVPFFFKQWGDWAPDNDMTTPGPHTIVSEHGHDQDGPFTRGHGMTRLGKHRAGRLLDGRTWDQQPAGQP